MGFVELFILAVGLSMDAFAVSICKGLAMREAKPRAMALVGLWFGGFQALMPLAGYLIGVQFSAAIEAVDHWLAFLLLAAIGGNMVKEALSKEEEPGDASLAPKAMVVLALATSIDALAVGVSFAFLSVDILPAVVFIGVTTFALSAVGVKVGSLFGSRYKSKAELFGGCILILLGLKILLEHLGILG
ncbi:manganese efflux pump [bacterium D16-76]|nr:manganese efflux pump [bacterium D16-76]